MLSVRQSIFVLIAAAAAVALLLLRPGAPPGESADRGADQRNAPPPESYSLGISTTQFNETGRIDYILQARRQVQLANNTISIARPDLRLFEASDERWHVTAGSGTIQGTDTSVNAIRQLDLSDAVQLEYTDGQQRQLIMRTEQLTVYPANEILHSNTTVELSGEGFEQTSAGMRAVLPRDSLVFFGPLQGRHHDLR